MCRGVQEKGGTKDSLAAEAQNLHGRIFISRDRLTRPPRDAICAARLCAQTVDARAVGQ